MPYALCIEGCSLLSPAYQQQERRSRVMYKFYFPLHFSSAASPAIFDTQIKEPVPSNPLYAPLPPNPNKYQQASTISLFLLKDVHLSILHKQKPHSNTMEDESRRKR